MEVGMIGLGRMGAGLTRRLIGGKHKVVAWDRQAESVEAAVRLGAIAAGGPGDLVKRLRAPRVVWVMVPAGKPTEDTIVELSGLLAPGDIVIDGGNSYYRDSMRRASALAEKRIGFLDAGTSGGIWGAEEGFCLMVGGAKEDFLRAEPLFKSLAPSPDQGYAHVGPAGAGHFVKMVHNGIEYGLLEAYAEGFELLHAKSEFALDLPRIAEVWRHGSVVRSWLLDLTADALRDDPRLEKVGSFVEDSGEGRWTVQESIELATPMPAITLALQSRFRSREDQPFAGRLVAALRNKFGGHAVRKGRRG